MMHVRFSRITADPPVLAGCLGYLQDEAQPWWRASTAAWGWRCWRSPAS